MEKSLGKICAVITEESTEAARFAIEKANTEADLLEIRLDYLRDFDFRSIEQLGDLLANRKLPTIITCRSPEEGGKQEIDNSIRLPMLIEGAKRFAVHCDIETAHYEAAKKLKLDNSRLILSYHDFLKTPDNLNEIYERMTRFPAAVYKIAVTANEITDTLPIFQLLKRAEQEQRQMIAIAMSEAGIITRVLGCSRGSLLTYGALADSKQSAPGQILCRELKDLYRLNHITPETQIMGILGDPVSHSLSPLIHNMMFADLNLDAVYLPLMVSNLEGFFRRMVKPESREINFNFRGFSVTIPHKTTIMPLFDYIHPTAAAIGAVNTILIEDDKLLGYNTDADGAMIPLEKLTTLAGESCAVIGSGGAARAIIYGLRQRQANVTIYARNQLLASQLADEFEVRALPLERLAASDTKILINTTPVGMRGYREDESIIPIKWLHQGQIIYDLVYNPLSTRLLKDAEKSGCRILGGLDMLIAQAALQFTLWTGRDANHQLMHSVALEKLSLNS